MYSNITGNNPVKTGFLHNLKKSWKKGIYIDAGSRLFVKCQL